MEVFPNGLKETQASILYGMFKTWFKGDYGGREPMSQKALVYSFEETNPLQNRRPSDLMVDRCTRSSLLRVKRSKCIST